MRPPSHGEVLPFLNALLASMAGSEGVSPSQALSIETFDQNIADTVIAVRSFVLAGQERIGQLARQRNALVPIHGLPIEVITQIFTYIVDKWSLYERPKEYYDRIHVLAQVCNAWMGILLAYPPFWTVVDGRCSDGLLKTTLRRSTNHPLRVSFAPESHSSVWPLVCHHIHRWETARVLCHNDALALLETSTAPILETLDLTSTVVDWTPVVDLFQGSAARLSQLRLRCVGLKRWDADFLSGIRTLDLIDLETSLRQILDCLRTCTALEQLSLDQVSFTEDDSEFTNKAIPPIQLSSLHSIMIRGTKSDVAAIIIHSVDIPNCMDWTFGCDGRTGSPLVAALVERMSPAFEVQPSETLEVEIGDDSVWISREDKPILIVHNELCSRPLAARWAKAALGAVVDGIPVKLVFRCARMNMGYSQISSLLRIAGDVTELAVVGVKTGDGLNTLLGILAESHTYMSPTGLNMTWTCPRLRRFTIFHSCTSPRGLCRMVEARTPITSELSHSTFKVERPVLINEFKVHCGTCMNTQQWKRIKRILGPDAICDWIRDEEGSASDSSDELAGGGEVD
ncbi:hypothetical protein FRB97_007873 [Tulasnella sp. 331]|nr:hypothetical protein FRB97_007873 [Tulasnella sp. 331]